MKEGYIVWNQTIYGCGYEFYGVYRNIKQAEKALRKWMKTRYGVYVKGDWITMLEKLEERSEQFARDILDGNSFYISHFPTPHINESLA